MLTNKEILYKAILKAEKNGYIDHLNYLPIVKVNNPEELAATIFLENCSRIIFSHSFAKAFWGTERNEYARIDNNGSVQLAENWQFHLQQMVLSPEPLLYLKDYI